jgi:hypothetical protein
MQAVQPFYHHESQSPVRGELALWRAVITQALMDAASNSAKMEAKHEKSQAVCWLTRYSEDFKTVCDFADYSPDYIRSRSVRALKRNCQWRNDARAAKAAGGLV